MTLNYVLSHRIIVCVYVFTKKRYSTNSNAKIYTQHTQYTYIYIYTLLKRSRFVCAKNQKINNEIVRNIDNNNIHK